jgi:hypothetical protein
MLVDEGVGGLHQKIPFYKSQSYEFISQGILVVDFGPKSYKGGGSVIPHL